MASKKKKYKTYTANQLRAIKESWNQLERLTELYYRGVSLMEKLMAKQTGLSDIEFEKNPLADDVYFGVGTASKSHKLLMEGRDL